MDAVNFALLLLRVVIGLTIFAHGYNHLFGGGRIPGTARWFDSMGMRPGKLNAWLATVTEMGTGVLFAAGLLTTFAAAGIVGLMLVAGRILHIKNGFFIVKEGWEYVFAIAITAVCLAMLGPGEWSIDDAIGIADDLDEWTGLILAGAIGVGGGLAQLAIFYRPVGEEP